MARQRTGRNERPSAGEARLDPRLEQYLIAAAWNEALAAITTGLAHDTNNCLTGILSMNAACLEQISSEHPMHESLDLVKQSAQNASQIIEQLMRMHHERSGQRAYYDLNLLTSEIAALLRKVLRRRIELLVQLETVALPVYIDAVELRQAIILLALNAAKCTPERGQIILRTSSHQKLPALGDFRGRLPRLPGVCLTISHAGDFGGSEQWNSALDGVGNGLGLDQVLAGHLYAAKMFAEKNKGAVSFEIEKGQNAAFRFWLPRADFTEGEPS